jgi:hypothetical protein
MDYETQMRLNAIVTSLVETEGETFDPDDACFLKDALPVTARKNHFTLKFPRLFKGGAFEGLTNTGHQLSSGDDGKKEHTISTKPTPTWIGNYALSREDEGTDTVILIEDRFYDTRDDCEDRSWQLQFDEDGPVALLAAKPKIVEFRFFLVSFKGVRVSYAEWKRPTAQQK